MNEEELKIYIDSAKDLATEKMVMEGKNDPFLWLKYFVAFLAFLSPLTLLAK